VQRAPNNILVTRWTIDQPAPPIFVKAGDFIGNVDCRQMIDYTPPVFLHPDVGATPTGTGAPEGRRVGEISMRSLNAITLETVTFGGRAAFLEEVAVFTAQHRSPTLHPNAPQVDMSADSGVI